MSGLYQAIEDVADFHVVTDTPVPAVPAWPSDERMALREDLITEEVVRELLQALRARDMVATSNAVADSIYVLIGLALELGLGNVLAEEWAATQRSNMAKSVLQPDGSFRVVRRPDGKILKPEGWTPPDTEGILRAHGWQGPAVVARTTFERSRVFGTRCDNCSQKESEHEWVCASCKRALAWDSDKFPMLCICGNGPTTLYCPT